MRVLLDTHVVLWLFGDTPHQVAATSISALESAVAVYVSAVSFAEIGIKVSVGKLAAPALLRPRLERLGFQLLALSAEHGLATGDLPMHHRDPFDRLLIAQATVERLTILTSDRAFANYDVPLLSAG